MRGRKSCLKMAANVALEKGGEKEGEGKDGVVKGGRRSREGGDRVWRE